MNLMISSKASSDAMLKTMGIDIWKERLSNPNEDPVWIGLQKEIASCTQCELSKTRKNAVFGTGNPRTNLLIIGEAPGANEDEQGKPFVGRAGMLLTSMLQAINIQRENIFIANILKCRPPNNRDPLPSEVHCCTPYLLKQIDYIKPKLILALGRIAAHFLLNTELSMSKLRGTLHTYGPQNTPLLITYHPAYLLRAPREKRKSYEDLLKVKTLLSPS